MATATDKETMDIVLPFNARRKMSFAQGDIVKYRRAFDAYNNAAVGGIEGENLGAAIEMVGYRVSQSKVQEILSNNNLDEKATITFELFLQLVPGNIADIPEEEHRLAELRERFQRYDLDRDGHISLEEASRTLQCELLVQPRTALRLLNQFVRLDYDQFVKFYSKIQDKKMEMYEKFGKYDVDCDGLISADEAHRVLNEELGFSKEKSQAMVNKFDINHDGCVSYQEFAEFFLAVEERKARIRKTFQTFDQENKGYVTADETTEILQQLLGFTAERSRKILEAYDKDQDGCINYEEFLTFYSMLEEERNHLLNEFSKFDQDGDGRISFAEFKSMLEQKGYIEKEIATFMAGYDLDQDGYLSFEEFKHFINFSNSN